MATGVFFKGSILPPATVPLPIADGGTGQITAAAAINALLPLQAGNSSKVLTTDGTSASWQTPLLSGPAGTNKQILFNNNGVFGGSDLLYENTTGVTSITGDVIVAPLSTPMIGTLSLPFNEVHANTIVGTSITGVLSPVQTSITAVGTLHGITTSGHILPATLTSAIGSITAPFSDAYATTFHGNVVGTALTADTVTVPAQPTISSLGILTNLSVSGNIIPSTGYSAFSFGSSVFGQTGHNNKLQYSSPTQIGNLLNWSYITSKYHHTTAIKANGTLWTWGRNSYGELGFGNTTNYSSPKQVGALSDWLSVASGGYHTLAIKNDKTLWAWGSNNNGQLGLGSLIHFSSPKQVGTLTNWLQVSAGYYCTSAISVDNTLWSWGNNGYGQLGHGNTTNYSSPQQVGALTNWLHVAAGSRHTTAIKTDGTLWAWGSNYYGQLGLSNTTYYSSPMQIGLLTNWVTVSPGELSTVAVKLDRTLWVWGANFQGQLGIGNTNNYSSPVQVGLLTNWDKIDAGNYHSTAIKTDGTLWTWGNNGYGQLGLGNTTYYYSPMQVGTSTSWVHVSAGMGHTCVIPYTVNTVNIGTSVTPFDDLHLSGTAYLAGVAETVVVAGNATTVISPDASAGTIYDYILTSNISLNTITNAVAGTSMTIKLTQDATGGRLLTSTMLFANGYKTLSTVANATDIISVFYDGAVYYASLSKGYV